MENIFALYLILLGKLTFIPLSMMISYRVFIDMLSQVEEVPFSF